MVSLLKFQRWSLLFLFKIQRDFFQKAQTKGTDHVKRHARYCREKARDAPRFVFGDHLRPAREDQRSTVGGGDQEVSPKGESLGQAVALAKNR